MGKKIGTQTQKEGPRKGSRFEKKKGERKTDSKTTALHPKINTGEGELEERRVWWKGPVKSGTC